MGNQDDSMTDIPATSLHPSLQKLSASHRRLTRLLSLLFFLVMASALIFMMINALSNRSMENLLIFAVAGLVVLPMIALMWGLLWYLERWMTRRISEANQLLRGNAPVSARLTPAGLNSKFGMLMALQLLDRRTASGPLYALIEPNFGWSRPPHLEMTIQLYCPDLKLNSRLVALHDGKVLMGKLVEGKAHYLRMKWIGIAAVAVLAIVAAVTGFFSFQGYQAYRNLGQQQQWAEASANWSQTLGRIVNAELATARIPKGKIRVDGYWPHIEFEYSIAGAAQRSDTPFFCNQPTTNREAAENWLTEYPSGAIVIVYYDYADPTRGVVKEGYTAACQVALEQKQWEVIFEGGLAGFLLLVLVVMAATLHRQFRQAQTFLKA
jgi:hypothetical protein